MHPQIRLTAAVLQTHSNTSNIPQSKAAQFHISKPQHIKTPKISTISTNIRNIQLPADQRRIIKMISLRHSCLSQSSSLPKVDGLTNQNLSNSSSSVSLKKRNTKQKCARTGLKQVNATTLRSVSSLMVKLNLSKKLLPINCLRPSPASNSSNIQLVRMATDVISCMMSGHSTKLSQRISTKRD